jgi:hypothetical protein
MQQAKTIIKRWIDERLREEYENCLVSNTKRSAECSKQKIKERRIIEPLILTILKAFGLLF